MFGEMRQINIEMNSINSLVGNAKTITLLNNNDGTYTAILENEVYNNSGKNKTGNTFHTFSEAIVNLDIFIKEGKQKSFGSIVYKPNGSV